jgi:hypothetical protein
MVKVRKAWFFSISLLSSLLQLTVKIRVDIGSLALVSGRYEADMSVWVTGRGIALLSQRDRGSDSRVGEDRVVV